MYKIRAFTKLVRDMISSVSKYDIQLMSASLSFFTMWAAIPLIYLLMQFLIHIDVLSIDLFMEQVTDTAPNFILKYLIEFQDTSTSYDGVVLVVFFFIMLWGASRAFNGIIQSSEIIYSQRRVRNPAYARLLALGMTLAFLVAFVLMISVTLITNDYLVSYLTEVPVVLRLYNYLKFLGLPITIFIIIMILQTFVIPEKRNLVLQIPGAFFTVVGWYGFSSIFSYYIRDFANIQARYGPFSSVIALYIWVYTMSHILLLGIVFNKLVDLSKLKLRRRK